MEKRELICIGCPLGCMMTVELEGPNILNITGNTCPKGMTYAKKEVISPTRMVTTTVKVLKGDRPLVSCKTQRDIPKEKISEVVRALKNVTIKAPVHIGDTLLSDVAGTGVEIVATSHVGLGQNVPM